MNKEICTNELVSSEECRSPGSKITGYFSPNLTYSVVRCSMEIMR